MLSLDYPEDQVEVLVASDGSDDATAAIARRYESMGVKLFELKARRGKLGALTFLLEHTRGQVTMFTDVGAVLPANALIELAGELSDPGVGVAVPRYVAQGKGSASAASDAAGRQPWQLCLCRFCTLQLFVRRAWSVAGGLPPAGAG